MASFLQYTLDLFGPFVGVDSPQAAPKKIANGETGGSHQPPVPLSQVVACVAFTHPRANREVRLGNAVVGYLFQRAKRRTIGFVVGPDGLVVRAPRWTPVGEVEAALREKSLWITRKLDESRQRQSRQHAARIVWRHGTVLTLLGLPIRVELDPQHTFGAVGAQLEAPGALEHLGDHDVSARMLRVGLPTTATPEQIRDCVQAWLMRHAREHFKHRLDHFAPLLQVQWRKLSLSSAGTRWGSARVDGSIRLNWRLIHFSPAVIDYVVAHELSHLRVMDHSERFWDTVRTVVPDYAALRGQLKDDAIPQW